MLCYKLSVITYKKPITHKVFQHLSINFVNDLANSKKYRSLSNVSSISKKIHRQHFHQKSIGWDLPSPLFLYP